MTDWLLQEINKIQGVVQAGAVLFCMGVVIATYVRTKAIVATVGAMVFAGVVLWSVNNTSWFEDKVGEEFRNTGAPGVVTDGR